MKWRQLLLLSLLVGFAWLTTSTSEPEPGPIPTRLENDLFESEALQRLLARVRPVVEAVVGASLGPPVPIIVADVEEYAAHAASRGLARLPPETPTEDRTMKWALVRSVVEATGPQAAVFCDSDGIWLIPHHIHEANGDKTERTLAILLAHELTHVHQDRQLGFEEYAQRATSPESKLARRAAVEGHAQWVARRVAVRLGLDDAFISMAWEMSRADESLGDALHRSALIEHEVETRFVYGQGEAFFEAVASQLGYTEAIERLRETPPAALQQILHPELWLERTHNASSPEAVPHLLRLPFELAVDDSESVLQPMLAYELGGSQAGETAVAGVLRSARTGLLGRNGLLLGIAGTLQVVDCTSPEAAQSFLRASVESAESAVNVWKILGNHRFVERAEITPWSEGDMHGAIGRLDVRASLEPASTVAFVTTRRGARVVSLFLGDPGTDGASLTRLARRLWALSATETASPPLPSILASASAAHWADRLAAAAALGLHEDGTRETRQALERLLEDPDPDVRLVALQALQVSSKSNSLERSVLDRALCDEDREVRLHAISALGRMTHAEPSLPSLLEALVSPDGDERTVAARALGPWIEKDSKVASGLQRALEDPDPRVRLAALGAWAKREDERLPPSEVLERLARDPDPEVRMRLLLSIGWQWNEDEAVRARMLSAGTQDASARVRLAAWLSKSHGVGDLSGGLLARGLRDEQAGVRAMALSAMNLRSIMGQSYDGQASAIRKALQDPHPQIRLAAVDAISFMRDGRWRYAPALVAMLDTPWMRSSVVNALGHESTRSPNTVDALCCLIRERKCRATVAEALADIGRPAHRAVPLLRTLLKVEHPLTRLAAAKALRELGEPSEPLVDVVLPVLHDPDFIHRCEAIKAAGAVSRPDLARLLRLRRDPSKEVRAQALKAWKARDRRPPRVVSQLQRMLTDPAPEVRSRAARTLDDIDGENHVSLKAIARLFGDEVAFVRHDVASALQYSSGDLDLVRPVIRETLKTGDPERQMEAALFLADGGDTSPVLVAGLLHALVAGESYQRDEAAHGLAGIVPRADGAIEPLKNALSDPESGVRAAAAAALLDMDPIAPATFRAVSAAFRMEGARSTRREYYDALVAGAAHSSELVPYLVELLESEDTWELRRASELLGAIGPGARAAVQALENLRAHSDVHVGDAAEAALAAIGGG